MKDIQGCNKKCGQVIGQKGLELYKSLELSEEELRTLRLNEYFKPRENLLNSNTNNGTHHSNILSGSVSTSTSVASNSHSNSMKKKERKRFFTGEAMEGENSNKVHFDGNDLNESLSFLKEI